MNQAERRRFLIEALLSERAASGNAGGYTAERKPAIPEDVEGQRALLRALMNVRPPAPVEPEVLATQDVYLAERLQERGGAVDAEGLAPVWSDAAVTHAASNAPLPTTPSVSALSRVALWCGDITTLAADAIMNAANAQMLGCFVPGHHCIDNAIHTFAGMQLRLACAELMEAQGHEEPTGQVKVTPAFNLPSRYVFHTVGPIVGGAAPTERDRALLRSCYQSCLEAATDNSCRTLAVCCLSTGVFGYSPREAAQVAVDTVLEYLAQTDSRLKVVFNVFLETDECIYRELLGERARACR